MLKEMKNYSESIRHFKKGLELPGAPALERKSAYDTLCRILIQENRIAELYPVARRGLKEFPGSGGLNFYWGMALLKEGFSTKAKARFKEAANDPVWRKAALERYHSIR
jgi:tetratricopeptide (TPR) repeat protein